MNKTLFFSLFLSIAILSNLYGCASNNVNKLVQEKGGKQLTAAQVLSLVEGNTLEMEGFDSDVFVYLSRSSRIFAVDIYENKDLGKWDVSEDGEFCIRMNNWWMGDMLCYAIFQINDIYKLADSKGVIQFTAHQFSGDYKNSFYTVKDKKKSYRKSARSSETVTTAEDPAEVVATEEVTTESALPEKSITEVNTYAVSQEDKNIRSTVKWMARDCPGCNLSSTNLMKADLVNAQLAGANLSNANLRMANLRRADLQSANLEYAILTHCNMPGANLRNANLHGADLKGANLIRADLTGADLSGADLEGALLEGVVGLKIDK